MPDADAGRSLEDIAASIAEFGAGRLVVGYSGGVDSSLLLHCARLSGAHLVAFHVNHGLAADAADTEEFCRQRCKEAGIAMEAARVRVRGRSQQAARSARFGAFRDFCSARDCLLLAHHADDQLETMLYRLMRGAGTQGLAGIPALRDLGGGVVLHRPLLGLSRRQILRLARAAGLQWREDASNDNMDYARNYLRRMVVPPLQRRWAHAAAAAADSADRLAGQSALLTRMGLDDLQRCEVQNERLGRSIERAAMMNLDPGRRLNMLRALAPQAPVRILAAAAAGSCINWRGGQVRHYDGRVWLLPPLAPPPAGLRLQWHSTEALQVAGLFELRAEGLDARLQVRLRICGERCKPLRRRHSQTLRRLFQEYRLEPWLRGRTPIICDGERVLAVAGLFACADGMEGLRLRYLGADGRVVEAGAIGE